MSQLNNPVSISNSCDLAFESAVYMWAVVTVTEFSFTIFQINERWSYYMQLSLLTRCLCGPFSLSFFLLETIAVTFGNQAFGSGRFDILQWLIQEGTGGPSPLIFRPNWGPKGRKKFFGDRSPLIQGSGWPSPLPPLFQGVDPALYSSTKTGEKENVLTVLGRSKFKFKSNLR